MYFIRKEGRIDRSLINPIADKLIEYSEILIIPKTLLSINIIIFTDGVFNYKLKEIKNIITEVNLNPLSDFTYL